MKPSITPDLPRLPESEVILTVDLGGVSAFAALRPGGRPAWGHVNFMKNSPSSGRVFSLLGKWLDDLIDAYSPALLVFESPFIPPFTKKTRLTNGEFYGGVSKERVPLNNHTIRRLYGLAAVAEMVADLHGVHCREVQTSRVCRFWTGRGGWGGRQKKKAETMRVAEAYGYSPVQEDESDTIAVAMYVEAIIWPRISERRGVGPLFRAQRETIDSRGARG